MRLFNKSLTFLLIIMGMAGIIIGIIGGLFAMLVLAIVFIANLT